MVELFQKGGPLMWPLLFCSFLSLTVIIERLIFWVREEREKNGQVVEKILHLTEKGKFDEALAASDGVEDAAARVLKEGLRKRELGIKESIEIAATEEIEKMKRGMTILDTIITLAPLLGILGTVLGIIESFDMLGRAGIENPRAVTAGIAQALITTAAGLSVAIVALIPFNMFVSKVRKVTSRLDRVSTRVEIACRKFKEDGHGLNERIRG